MANPLRLVWAALAVATVAGGVARAAPAKAPAKHRAKAKKAAEVVVVAELLRGSSQPHCGVIAAVGEFEYRVVAAPSKGVVETAKGGAIELRRPAR